MNNLPSSETNEPLRPVLERIAAALEKGNEASKGKDDQGDKKDGEDKGEDGGKDKEKDGGKDGEAGKEKKESKAKKFFLSPLGIILMLVILAILVIAGIALWNYESTHESTNDAYTTTHVHQISPRADESGRGAIRGCGHQLRT